MVKVANQNWSKKVFTHSPRGTCYHQFLSIFRGNVNWCSHHGEQYGGSVKTRIELPHDPAIPLLGIHSEKMNLKRHMHPSVHCSTIYNSQDIEGSRCPSTVERIKKMHYIYTKEYYLVIKRNLTESVAERCLTLEPVTQSKVSQTEKNKYHI